MEQDLLHAGTAVHHGPSGKEGVGMWILPFYWDGARPSAEANLSPLRTKALQPWALRIPRK